MTFTFPATYIALWALVVFQGLLLLAVLQHLAKLRQLVTYGGVSGSVRDRLPIGTEAPGFSEREPRFGAQVGIDKLSRGGIILFLSADCSVCKDLADRIGRHTANDLPPTLAICRGGEQACAGTLKGFGSSIPLLVDDGEEMVALYRISSFPTAVVVDGERKIRGYGHPKDIEDLKTIFAQSSSEAASEISVAPELSTLSSK